MNICRIQGVLFKTKQMQLQMRLQLFEKTLNASDPHTFNPLPMGWQPLCLSCRESLHNLNCNGILTFNILSIRF